MGWDANDLPAKLDTWQRGANDAYGGDFAKALGAIRARAILIPCSTDLYFPPEDNEIEAGRMPNAELRVLDSPWGHCVASPGRRPEFSSFLNDATTELPTGRQHGEKERRPRSRRTGSRTLTIRSWTDGVNLGTRGALDGRCGRARWGWRMTRQQNA